MDIRSGEGLISHYSLFELISPLLFETYKNFIVDEPEFEPENTGKRVSEAYSEEEVIEQYRDFHNELRFFYVPADMYKSSENRKYLYDLLEEECFFRPQLVFENGRAVTSEV